MILGRRVHISCLPFIIISPGPCDARGTNDVVFFSCGINDVVMIEHTIGFFLHRHLSLDKSPRRPTYKMKQRRKCAC